MKKTFITCCILAAASYISGIQEQGVMSTIKHFAVSNQEFDQVYVAPKSPSVMRPARELKAEVSIR